MISQTVFLLFWCRHPLFPLLALLFEKCEQSTQSSDCITSASFDVDIENFVRSQEKEGKAFFSEDPDLDNLVRGWGHRAFMFSYQGFQSHLSPWLSLSLLFSMFVFLFSLSTAQIKEMHITQ